MSLPILCQRRKFVQKRVKKVIGLIEGDREVVWSDGNETANDRSVYFRPLQQFSVDSSSLNPPLPPLAEVAAKAERIALLFSLIGALESIAEDVVDKKNPSKGAMGWSMNG